MLSHFDVDGIPAVFAKRPGPLSAGLVFRVGRADETLPIAGITHMVEHLALHRFGLADYHIGGATGLDHTFFRMQGAEDEVVAFLSGVCASLVRLPMDRLETEKAILRTEESGRSTGVLRRYRYGAQGYGLADFPELGVPLLRPDQVAQWARTWFTRENAVLWVAGEDVPAGLRLQLPPGTRRPVPQRRPLLTEPGCVAAGDGQILLSSVVRRGAAAKIFAKVLEREMFRSLRQEGGFSYTAATSYTDRGDDFAEIIALADALPDKQDAALGEFVDVLARFKIGRIDPRDIDAARARTESELLGADAEQVAEHAVSLLGDRACPTVEEEIEELRTVGAREVHAVAAEALGSALVRVPVGRSADWAGFTPLPQHSEAPLEGTRFAGAGQNHTVLIIGADGCGLFTPKGMRSVRYGDCAALLTWPDGTRRLIGVDGTIIPVDRAEFPGLAPQHLATIDAAVDPGRVIPQPGEMPRPAAPTAWAAPPVSAVPKSSAGGTAATIALVTAASIFGLLALLTTLGGLIDPSPEGGDALVASVFLWLPTALFVFLLVRRRRKRRS